MWRSIVIIVLLCGTLAWVLTGGDNAPQRSGTLTINPAPDFPKEKQKDLGQSVAKILPHCPGLARFGGEVLFTELQRQENMTKVIFTVPSTASVPQNWGAYNAPCTYMVEADTLRIEGAPCQALCLGKLPDAPQNVLTVDLNPAPTAGK